MPVEWLVFGLSLLNCQEKSNDCMFLYVCQLHLPQLSALEILIVLASAI